jgi:hypothetical protein
MKKSEVFPSKYLKATDVPNPTIARIEKVKHEAMQDGVIKPIITFDKWRKPMVCNVTNADVLYYLAHSDDDDAWSGMVVEVYVEPVRFNGKMVPSLKLRGAPRRAEAAKPENAPAAFFDDEIPF